MGMRYSSQFNLDKLRQNLFARQGRFNKDMREAAEQGAEMIMKRSQDNVPIDTYNLEQAHHIERTLTAADHVRFTVEVSGIGYGSEDPRPVEEYAMLVHEHYESIPGTPGPKTAAKMTIVSEKPKAIELIRQAVRKNWSK
jgi:hypothetical protein